MQYAPDLHAATRDKLFYTLVMFPYPSGSGLHVGHASNFVINDVLARYKRFQGYTVFNPFGFDSFGLPTENYAMKVGKPAYQVTEENLRYFKEQINALNLSFDTKREVVTSTPEYYKRTQRIFQQLYKAGLVYRDTLRVNRCPECQTVLANDQVVDGACERCKSDIVQKKHPQWFIKITDYAERLLDDLDDVDRPEETKIAQKNRIGKSDGVEIDFTVQHPGVERGDDDELSEDGDKTLITVFTTRPETIYGVTALVLAPENMLLDEILEDAYKADVETYRQTTLAKTAVQRQQDLKEKTGVFSGLYAFHPLHGKRVPIWYADYVLADYGSGAVMMVPAHDTRDREFAQKFSIPMRQVIAPHYISGNAPVEGKKIVKRNNILCLLFDEQREHVLCLDRKSIDWKSFVMGGIEVGEEVVDAGFREICEETGYDDVEFIESMDRVIHAEYFAEHKQVNRYSSEQCLVYRLKSTHKSDQEPDTEHHTYSWIPVAQVGSYLAQVPGGVNSNALFRERYHADNKAYTGTGVLINSAPFDGIASDDVKKMITDHIQLHEIGRKITRYKLRDRSVSRQRYRGSPIPVYYDQDDKPHLIPEEELPVVLPLDLENYKPTGKSPLEDHPTFPQYTPKNTDVPFFEATDGPLQHLSDKPYETRQVVCVIIKHHTLDKYLLLKHHNIPSHEGTHGYAFVTGGKESGEDAVQAAIREAQEETGYQNFICLEDYSDDEIHSLFYANHKKTNRYLIQTCVVLKLENTDRDEQVLSDHDDFELLWIEKEEVAFQLSYSNQQYVRAKHLGKDPLVPAWTNKYNAYNPLPTYRRECDTLDTFMCSSFYFLRYPDANNPDHLGDSTLLNKCFPIDFYVGGKEHTVGHLLYARFIHKFLYDQGRVSCAEPFKKLIHQGMVVGSDGRKMSKRRGNVIDPMQVIEKYGSDAVRTYLMFMGPVEQDKVWNDAALAGIAKFLQRIHRLTAICTEDAATSDDDVQRALHLAIKGVTHDMEKLKYNTAVSKLMILLNSIEEKKVLTKDQLSIFLILLFPFAPDTAGQIWTEIGMSGILEEQQRPVFDDSLLVEETILLPVQVNGKLRTAVSIVPESSEADVLSLALKDEQIKKYLEDQDIRKVIYVQNKILNLVVG